MAVEHIGSTSVPGLPAKDVIDLQVAVRRLSDADVPEFVKALADKGFPRSEGNDQDTVHAWAPDAASWAKRFHGSADPGRVTHVHVREQDSAGWEASLLFRDWLVANPVGTGRVCRPQASARPDGGHDHGLHPGQGAVDRRALERARVWARHTGWGGP